jgi:DNA invertase Pin-like site-specific DNA recombinase
MNHRRITASPDEIQAMIDNGMTHSQIAAQFGCSRSTVFNALDPERYERLRQARPSVVKPRRGKPLIKYAGWARGD